MTRVLLLGLVLALTACSAAKTIESLCAGAVPEPVGCNLPCDPAPGAPSACIAGYHCSADGKCDKVCNLGGAECGDGNACTTDGRCVPEGEVGIDPDASCPEVHFTATKTIPSIQLLIDRSGSMLHDFADERTTDNSLRKYTAEVAALVGPQGVVTQLQSSVYFNASMYPGATCPGLYQSDNGRQLNNKPAIESLLAMRAPDSTANTPTPASIDLAVADFMAHPAPPGSPPVIVLATDGLPNDCDGNNAAQARLDSIEAARNASRSGIRLYLLVVGTKIDDTFKRELANAGQGVQAGQPDAVAYTATDPASLSAAFQDIIRGVVSCDLRLDGGMVDPADASGGIVTLNGKDLAFGTDWTLDADKVTIHLLGEACATLKSSPDPKVDAVFACGAVVL